MVGVIKTVMLLVAVLLQPKGLIPATVTKVVVAGVMTEPPFE
jgi:hypothetical protein